MKKLSQYALLTEMEKLESLESVIGGKDENCMNSKINYTDEPIELGEIVEDFLPHPEKLILKGETVQETMNHSLNSQQLSLVQEDIDRQNIGNP